MSKSIEDFTIEMQEFLRKDASLFAEKLASCKEEILVAFMAKYGLNPEDVRLCYQGNKFWVDKIESIKPTPEYDSIKYKYQSLVDYLMIVLCDMPIDKVCDPVFIGIENKLKSLGEIKEDYDNN